MGTREDLVAAEDERWAELCAILAELPQDRMDEAITPDWSVKDLLAHVGCWMAEAAHVLERMRLGTWKRRRLDIDAMNAQFYEAFREADLKTVRTELESSRIRMLQEWQAIPEITEHAEEWFRESGPAHLDEHLPDLRRFAGRAETG